MRSVFHLPQDSEVQSYFRGQNAALDLRHVQCSDTGPPRDRTDCLRSADGTPVNVAAVVELVLQAVVVT